MMVVQINTIIQELVKIIKHFVYESQITPLIIGEAVLKICFSVAEGWF